jgi:hypothetical protein
VIKQVGAEAFAYASDYPHEVDLVAAKQMIHETIERADLINPRRKGRGAGREREEFF